MAVLEKRRLKIGRKPALLVVDASVAFTDPESPLGSDAESVVAVISRLLAAFRECRLPVFFTSVAYSDPGQASVFREKVPALNLLQSSTPLVEIDPRLAPRDDEVILVKHWVSAFFGTDLRDRLHRAGIDTLFVTGFTTSGCVRASAVDALQCNFRVIVPREAVGDRNLPAHEANLHDLDCKYADVVSLDEALAILDRVKA